MSNVAELRAFLESALASHRQEWAESTSFEARLAWQRTLQAQRWVAPNWPTEAGGRGLDVSAALDCSVLLADLGAPEIAGIFGVLNVGPTILRWGTDEQKAHLPRILEGSELWCQGFSEPGAGSDLAGLQTTARLEGDEFIIDGQKVWTSQGLRADYIQLLVRTDRDAPKHRGISALLVPLNSPGIDRRPIRQINGDAEFAEVFFDGVRVPRESLLGPLNGGWKVTMTTLDHERTALVGYVARQRHQVEGMIEHYRRAAADCALDSLEADELVQRYVEAAVLNAVCTDSMEAMRISGEPGPEQTIIKLEWSLLSQRLANTAINLAGPTAVAGADDAATSAYLTERSATIAGGTTEILTGIIARRVLGLPA